MRQNDDGKTVAAMDLLVPRVIIKSVFILNLSSGSHQICLMKL